MSLTTVNSSSNSDDGASKSYTNSIESGMQMLIFDLPSTERMNVCYFLDQENLWEEAAHKMGYSQNDIVVSVNIKIIVCLNKINVWCIQNTDELRNVKN